MLPNYTGSLACVYACTNAADPAMMPGTAVLRTGGGDGLYTNPVVAARCASTPPATWGQSGCEEPDPGVVRLPGAPPRWLALTTTIDGDATFARHISADLASWRPSGHVWNSSNRPRWALGSFFAPELHAHGRRWVLVFSAQWSANGRQAVGAAFADSPDGPFVDPGAPIALPHNNTNDPTLVHTPGDGSLWLLYKAKAPDRIFAQRVDATGTPTRLQPAGVAVQLLRSDLPWESGVVEAPWVVTTAPRTPSSSPSSSWLYLFYAGDFDKQAKPPDHKAIGVARSKTIVGPWEKRPLPILHASPNFTTAARAGAGAAHFRISPGHCSVVETATAGRWAIVYHSSLAKGEGKQAGPREMMLDSLAWGADGWPSVDRGADVPSQTPRPVPSVLSLPGIEVSIHGAGLAGRPRAEFDVSTNDSQ